MRYNKFCLLLCIVLCPLSVLSQTRTNALYHGQDPRGAAELVICNQNLKNYGSLATVRRFERGLSASKLREREKSLVIRFLKKKCDVIAVQEVLGKTRMEAELALQKLAGHLRKRSNRFFEAYVGSSNDRRAHLGFLVAADRAELLSMLSYSRVQLPKLSAKQKPRLFTRGPFEVQLKVKSKEKSSPKTIALINFHFKSKRSSSFDPADLEWETYRMEMAEALRTIVIDRHEQAFLRGETILVILGDRNSHFDVASAKILEGVLQLEHFQEKGACRLSKRGVPLCQVATVKPQRLFSPLLLDPQTKKLPGTYRYKKVYSWLDDILMPAESLRFAWAAYNVEGDFNSGLMYEPTDASDHAMSYVVLNW